MISVNDPLESARYMLARAQHHADELHAQIGIYLDSRPLTIVAEYDPDMDEHVYKVKVAKTLPAMLNGIASDAICNLRSALDQSMYACCVAAGGRKSNTHFPFGDTDTEVESRKTRGSSDVPPDIFVFVKQFQPYKGGDDLLWALNKLANANKHRILSPMATIADDFSVGDFAVLSSGPVKVFLNPTWDRTKNELEFARIRHTPEFNMNGRVNFTELVSFGEVDVVFGSPADGVLNHLIGKIDSILRGIEAEARRIGLFK